MRIRSERFTREYFISQCLEMRQNFGSRAFWDRPEEEQDAALQGLFYVYVNADDITDGDMSTFQAIFGEFVRRRELINQMELGN